MSAVTAPPTATWGGRVFSSGTDPRPPFVEGKHAFVVAVAFQVRNPAAGEILLDPENAYYISSVSCRWCRATEDDGAPCPGLPG